MRDFIPVSEPLIGEKEIEYVLECLKSGWISSQGKFIEEFEARWANYCGRKYGVSVSSGTAALQVAVRCIINSGDEVVMPTFTIISPALAVAYAGGKISLVDSDRETWTMNVDEIEKKITPRTKAILVVHIYGHPVDMDKVMDIARKYNIFVLEDAAEAHGAEYKGKKCGSFGDISVFSFYANKIITTGEGGMILTDDEEIFIKAKSLRNLCFGEGWMRFHHTDLGFNFRMTNIQAAIGLAQLERIQEQINKKRWIAMKYIERLRDLDGIILPCEKSWAKNVYWMFGIVIKEETGFTAKDVSEYLLKFGIETRPFFLGIHRQEILRNFIVNKDENFPVSDFLSKQGLYLPCGLKITEEEIDKVSKRIREILS